MESSELRQNFLSFFEKHRHNIVPSSSLLPSDPSVLFTTAGMQQFKPYYLGEKSLWGPNVVSCQKCIRTSDIEEVGDKSHLTFFEMLGNFSFDGYFKERAIQLANEFITKELGLKIDYVTVFKGDENVPPDEESEKIWKSIDPKIEIKKEGKDNFWGPTGEEGPCGPTTEIYVNGIEIWNIVFNEFFCNKDKKLEKLKIPGVDTGMGLERLVMAVQKKETVFKTDLFAKIISMKSLEHLGDRHKRIVADHLRAAVFLIDDGVVPSNKDQGYVLRRLLRRTFAIEHLFKLSPQVFEDVIISIINQYKEYYPTLLTHRDHIINTYFHEWTISKKEFERGISEYNKKSAEPLRGKDAFLISSTYALPLEIILWFEKERGRDVEKLKKEWDEEFKKHQELSRTASAGMFKGGLADHSPETIKLHTAHHLLLAVLQELFGKNVKQKGSNINSERLRIDFSFERKLTDSEKKKVEGMVNEKIQQGLNVVKREMPLEEAEKTGAEMEFGVKYGNTVSVYFIEDKKGNVFSKEFCGGPHVNNTSELGRFKIIKEEAVSSGVRRIKAILE